MSVVSEGKSETGTFSVRMCGGGESNGGAKNPWKMFYQLLKCCVMSFPLESYY